MVAMRACRRSIVVACRRAPNRGYLAGEIRPLGGLTTVSQKLLNSERGGVSALFLADRNIRERWFSTKGM